MINTLYQSKGRHATWLELFFDLVFVAVIGVVTHDLAHTHGGHIGLEQLLRFPLVFIPVWWIWMSHTLYANRFDKDNREHKLFSLSVMGILVIMSTFAKDSLGASFAYFVFLYAIVRLMLAALYWNVHRSSQGDIIFAKDIALATTVGALISISAIFMEGPLKYAVFYLGIAIDAVWQIVLRNKLTTRPIDKGHLVERMGLLAIIILGESMIAMVASLSKEVWDVHDFIGATAGLLLVAAIWWVYFDSFPILERAKRLTTGSTLIYSHLMLCMGLLILANMIRHAILEDLDRPTFGLLSITGLILFYLGKQVPYWYAFPSWRRAIISNTFICVSITVASSFLPRIEYSLVGMTLGMLVYVLLTFKRILTVNVDEYLDEEH